jgi:hypothetical protein
MDNRPKNAQLPGRDTLPGEPFFATMILNDSRFRLAGLASRTQAEHTAQGDRQQAQHRRQQGCG